MTMKKPFVNLFKTSCGCYMFDVNKNTILKIPSNVYDALDYEQSNGVENDDCDEEVKNYIKWIKGKGFLSSHKALEIIHPMDDILEDYLDRCVEKITLQVTQMCNLRCRYCPYSGFGDTVTREHSNKVMTFETAKKGINFLISHSRDIPVINVGFYGGEPLMEFELIKKIVDYAIKMSAGKRVFFSMTTNATLLTEEMMEFLQKYEFYLLISLDGPMEVHDKNRRFASDGTGSYNKIVENMKRFKKLYPNYFEKISFNAVIDPANDLGCTNEFFMNFDMLLEANLSASYLDSRFSREKEYVSEKFMIDYNYEMFKVYLNQVGRLDKEFVSPVIVQQYISSMKPLVGLKREARLPDKIHHGGPCVVGKSKLFIDVNGRLLPCERVSENSEAMIIGDLDSGFDFDEIRALMNVGKLTEEECKDCWAIRYCSLCAAFADDCGRLSGELKKTHCKNVRLTTEELFKNYATLKEYNYERSADISL